MDPLFTQAQLDIQERMTSLPEDVARAITDGTLDAVLLLLQDKYPLSDEQVTMLGNEIILVMMLYFLPKDFVDNIQESLTLQRPTAEAIGVEVNESIFEPFEDFFELAEKSQEELERGVTAENIPTVIAKKEDLRNLANTFAKPVAPSMSSQGGISPLVEPTDGLVGQSEDVEPLRTMDGDMSRIHGYGAYVATHSEILQDEEEHEAPQEEIGEK